MDMQNFIDGLTPEQKERLKGCRGSDDIIAFAKQEGLALPDEYLSRVAGGGELDPSYQLGMPLCPDCHNSNIEKMVLLDANLYLYYCQLCGAIFTN